MITLHYKNDDPESETLKKSLDDLVLAYKVVKHEENHADHGLPFIEEDSVIYSTPDEIETWLTELQDELKWQRSLSGDGCYINPKSGKVC